MPQVSRGPDNTAKTANQYIQMMLALLISAYTSNSGSFMYIIVQNMGYI